MTSLATLLNTSTSLWAGALLGIVIGALVGVFATMALARRRDESAPASAAPDGALRQDCLEFIEAADNGHNSLLSVDPKALEDVELEDALDSDNPAVRKLAQSILTMASLQNSLRIIAPKDVLSCADSLFELVAHSAMDGVKDRDGFSSKYQGQKSELISAARKSLA